MACAIAVEVLPSPRMAFVPISSFIAFRRSPFVARSQEGCRRVFRAVSSVTPTCAQRVVFLGTPAVAASSLQRIHEAAVNSRTGDHRFDVVAVVTQPPAPVGRKRVLTPSPVHGVAEDLGIGPILTPASARDEEFLSALSRLEPDLCVTAAYGNLLPKSFLDIPRLGTLNIHPSLLPQFRGAAPVPRALEAGVSETGVSVAFTELKMDSGPIVSQTTITLDGTEHAPDLLQRLFDIGTDSLIACLPSVFRGEAATVARAQDEAAATHAPKLSKSEARISFCENAVRVHNKVRAFSGWPGTWADFVLHESSNGTQLAGSEEIRLKILSTRVLRPEGGVCLGVHDVRFTDDSMLAVTCDDGSMLGLENVQLPGKKVMSADAFWNGLRGRQISRKRVPH